MSSTSVRYRRSRLGAMALGLTTAITALSLLASAAEAQRARRGAATEAIVSVYDVKAEPVRERVAAVGSGRALAQVTLTTRVAGVISEVQF